MGGTQMETKSIATQPSNSLNSDIQKDKNAQNLVSKIIGTFLMFAACLMVCHSLGLIHMAIGHFSF
ncbi:hypothetical protein VB735_34060 [Halotia wernerae UHCC 0503]|nr:hypothetical protein [Halotia wernerae UHCC 0503]